ncbi:tol-pal system protein YbgF [Taurinivorans muris]|uniref:Tol-pal system protein YbgF n=1 Tax=Taurinivorans muris TaxID=2787751 RepID=A0ABY5XYY9_9BACT|nr:tol-pal system protein YbgF [Desulfovibrionaceae bacterium LT0009]
MKKFLYIMPVLLLSACSSVNTQQNQRLESIEEKVDALLVYNNKTYDIMVDNELRISELEKDAKVRGVPVPQKNITVDSLPSPHAVIKNEEPQPLPEQEASAVKNVGALTGQDLTSQDLANQPLTKAEEKNQLQVTENIVEAPKQEQAAETGKQIAASGKPQETAVQTATQPEQKANAGQNPAGKELKAETSAQASEKTVETIGQTAQAQQGTQSGTGQAVQAQQAQPVQNQTAPTVQAEANQPPTAAQTTDQPQTSRQLYDKAYNLYQKKQYAASEKVFDEFLAKYPQDVLAPNALYWKGETLYARAIYPQAIFSFKEVQTRYPKHPKTADSLLKTAMSYARLGDKENASLHYLVLIEDWPQSGAAQKARAMGAQ